MLQIEQLNIERIAHLGAKYIIDPFIYHGKQIYSLKKFSLESTSFSLQQASYDVRYLPPPGSDSEDARIHKHKAQKQQPCLLQGVLGRERL